MEYWSSSRWKIAVIEQGVDQWIDPELPYALIGSHPCCTIQISEPRVAPFVYFACCFADSVEVWPLCPIAFPRWGVTLPEHTLAVGKKRISLFHQSHPLWPDIADRGKTHEQTNTCVGPALGVRRQITLDWDGKQRPKKLARRVMILGGEHPSTLRLYGQGLAPCDHAVVCAGASVWLINLNPDSDERDPAKLCRSLASMSAPEVVGNIKLRLGKVLEPREKSGSSASLSGLSSLGLKTSAQGTHSPVPKSDLVPQTKKSDPAPSRPNALSGSQNDNTTTTPEVLTTKLTDQLVRIDHARFTRRRVLTTSAIVAGFLISLVTVLWIVFVLLIPMITKMMG